MNVRSGFRRFTAISTGFCLGLGGLVMSWVAGYRLPLVSGETYIELAACSEPGEYVLHRLGGDLRGRSRVGPGQGPRIMRCALRPSTHSHRQAGRHTRTQNKAHHHNLTSLRLYHTLTRAHHTQPRARAHLELPPYYAWRRSQERARYQTVSSDGARACQARSHQGR